MNPAFKIAWRYFRGKKKAQAINIISWISMIAIAVSSAAMIILFSVFNGLENTVKSMYSAFYPEIKVTTLKGKFFEVSDAQKAAINKVHGLQLASYSLEDMALFMGNKEQKVGILKGVDNAWFTVCGLNNYIVDGKAAWQMGDSSYTPAIAGLGVAMSLGIDVNNDFSGLKIFYPKQGASVSENPEDALNNIIVKPQGTFRIQEDFDDQYVLVPLQAAQYLFHVDNKISSIDIKLQSKNQEAFVRAELKKILGNQVDIENRFEQNKTFFMITNSEKWFTYAILLMVLLIASFNMIGSLSMVVLEKKKDILILRSMGADKSMIRNIFLIEGGLLAFIGGGFGIMFAVLLCLGQQHFGWVTLPDGFIITAYPVALHEHDILLVLVTVLTVGLLAAWYPASKAARQSVFIREE